MRVNPETFKACAAKIAAKGRISRSEALDLLDQVATRAETMRQTGVEDPFVSAAAELASQLKNNMAKDKGDVLRNAMIRNGVYEKIEQAGGLDKAAITLQSLLHGTLRGDAQSIEGMWNGNTKVWYAQYAQALRKLQLQKAFKSGGMDRDVAREMWAMKNGEPPVNPGSAGYKVAKITNGMLEMVRNRLNAAGARIGDADDFVASTEHDWKKMRALAEDNEEAFNIWWAKTKPRLGQKTFDLIGREAGETAQQAQDKFGRSVWDALVSGVHKTQNAEATGFQGPRNLARALSESRVLYWKDADAWHDHMQEFASQPTLNTTILGALSGGARNLALMEKLGTNPRANLNLIMRGIEEKYRSDVDGVRKFFNRREFIDSTMDYLDGTANTPSNEIRWRIFSTARLYESLKSLGNVGLTHLMSVWPTVPAELRFHGISRTESLSFLMRRIGQFIPNSAERQAALAELGAFSDGFARDSLTELGHADDIPGTLSSIANTFFTATGIHAVYDRTQAAVRELLSFNLARNVGKAFGDLHPRLQRMLGRYGLDEGSWDLLRTHGELTEANGYKYLTPYTAHTLDGAAAEAHLRAKGLLADDASAEDINRAVYKLRNDLTDKLATYYGDGARHAIVTPGAEQRAFVARTGKAGSWQREGAEFMAQFKMWPIAAMMQVLGREYYLSTSKFDYTQGMAMVLGMSMLGGYLRMSTADYAQGRPLRDPMDPKTLIAALAQGGGLGIWGDYVFGETNRLGGGVASTFLGPAVSDVANIITTYQRFKDDLASDPDKALEHLWPELARGAVRSVPFANLLYVKGALDYMLWYHLYEAASPGWWERTNRRLIREQGRPMTGYTPGGAIPWTPWGIGSQTEESGAGGQQSSVAAPEHVASATRVAAPTFGGEA
jgi:hypothetical protein